MVDRAAHALRNGRLQTLKAELDPPCDGGGCIEIGPMGTTCCAGMISRKPFTLEAEFTFLAKVKNTLEAEISIKTI